MLPEKAFFIAKIPKHDAYQRAVMLTNKPAVKPVVRPAENMSNKELEKGLHKSITRKLKKKKSILIVYRQNLGR